MWTPASVPFTAGLWWDQSDAATGFTDDARTTLITADGDPVGGRTDKSGLGNHFAQATGSFKPLYFNDTGIRVDALDGLDDGGSTATVTAGTFTSAMDCFIAVKKINTAQSVIVSQTPSDGSRYFGISISGSAALAAAGVGSAWSYWVDGVQVGGVNTTTCGQLHTALGSGAWKVLEVRDVNMALWTQVTLGRYASFMLGADIAGVILRPAMSDANRALHRTWLGAKVGKTL